MIKEEAIEHGKEALEVFGGEHREFIELAIECIEKQIPEKPRIEYMPLFKAYCPICGGRLLPSKWCPKCGQAILWESDTE